MAELKINFAARLALVLGFLVLALAVSYGHNMKGLPGPAANPESVTAVMLKRLKIEVPQDVAAELPHLTVKANRIPAAVDAAPPFEGMTDASGADANRALICLTGAIYYEARSQSDDGQRAVAQVVLNRVRDRAFPNSVCGVVLQGAHRATGCQFSFTCDRSMDRALDDGAWRHARAIAAQALAGEVYAPVGSATFYHANYVQPWWASTMDKVATVGAHIFYRWAPALESRLAFRQSYSGQEPVQAAFDGSAASVSSPAPYRSLQRAGRCRSIAVCGRSWRPRRSRQRLASRSAPPLALFANGPSRACAFIAAGGKWPRAASGQLRTFRCSFACGPLIESKC